MACLTTLITAVLFICLSGSHFVHPLLTEVQRFSYFCIPIYHQNVFLNTLYPRLKLLWFPWKLFDSGLCTLGSHQYHDTAQPINLCFSPCVRHVDQYTWHLPDMWLLQSVVYSCPGYNSLSVSVSRRPFSQFSRSSPCLNSSPSIKSYQCCSSRLVVDHSQWSCLRLGRRQRVIPSLASSIVFSCRLLIVHPASRPFVQSRGPSLARAMFCSTARLRLVLARLDFMALLTRRLQQTVYACSPLCQSLSNSKVVQCGMRQPLIGPSPHSVLESSHLHQLSS